MESFDDDDNGAVLKWFIGLAVFCVLVIIPGAWYLDDVQSAKECTGKYNTRSCHQGLLDSWNKEADKLIEERNNG